MKGFFNSPPVPRSTKKIVLKPLLTEKRRNTISAIMRSDSVREFIKDRPREERENTRRYVREFVEEGYDRAMADASSVILQVSREL